MKKLSSKKNKVLLGTVLIGCLATSPIFAETVQKQIMAISDSTIKVVLDGKEVELRDANKSSITPIIYNGTTYLPVRSVSNALGLSVNWDDKNRQVILNSENKKVGDNGATTSYQLTEETYTNKGIKIKFPQIINLGDAEKQKRINQMIKEDAIAPYEETINGLEASSTYEAEVSYKIKLKNDKTLSIAYSSFNNINPSAHPYNLFHTTNIDLTNGKRITLADIIPKIDKKFVKTLRNAKYVGEFSDDPAAVKNAASNAFGEQSDSDILKWISGDEKFYFYLTKDGVGISVPVGHVLGDHAEFEISNTELEKLK